ncbi:hypothetical protein CCYA_CCYA02G0523 [Cyanidiococcus yangmingshanensis]|nr:hypothetical protein CCYA_CCYA02G0523 [Cyanidiococcus yangmingshanensis]
MPQQAPYSGVASQFPVDFDKSLQTESKTGMKPTNRAGTATLATQPRYWSEQEHSRFLEALELYGFRDVRAIAEHVATRTATQVRTHAQKYYLRLAREAAKLVLNFVNGDVQLNNDQIWEYFILSQQVDSQTGMRIPLAAIDAARDQFRAQSLLDVLQRNLGDSGSSLDGRPAATADHTSGPREFERATTRENAVVSRKKGRRRRSMDDNLSPSGTELYLVGEQGVSGGDGPDSTSMPFKAPDEMDGPDELAALLETESYDILELVNSAGATPRRDSGWNRRTRSNSRGRSGSRRKHPDESAVERRARSLEIQAEEPQLAQLKQPSPKEANRALEKILSEDTLQMKVDTNGWDPERTPGQCAPSVQNTTGLSFGDSSAKLASDEEDLNESNAYGEDRGRPNASNHRFGVHPGSEMFRPADSDIDLLQRGLEAFAQDPQCESRAKHYADVLHLPLHLGGTRATSSADGFGADIDSDLNREAAAAWFRRPLSSSPMYLQALMHDRHMISFSPTPETASPLMSASPPIMTPVDDLELAANVSGANGTGSTSNAPIASSQSTLNSLLQDRNSALSPLVRTLTPRTLAMQRTASTQSIMQLLTGKPTDELPQTAWMFLNSIGDGQEDRFLQMLQQIDNATTRASSVHMNSDGAGHLNLVSTMNAVASGVGVGGGAGGGGPRGLSSQMTGTEARLQEGMTRAWNRGGAGQASLLSTRASRLTNCTSWGSLARLPSNTSFPNLGDPNAVAEDLDRM